MGTRVQMIGTAAGTTFINTIYLQNDVATVDWPTLATKADNDWIRKVNVFQSQILTWHTVVINLTSSNGPSAQSFPVNRPGALSGLLPMQLAFVVKVQTGLAGKGNFGRWYISGLSTSQNNNGLPSSSSISQWQTQNAAILAAWSNANPLGGPLCLYARKRNLLIPVTNLVVNSVFGTVQSRKFGRGI